MNIRRLQNFVHILMLVTTLGLSFSVLATPASVLAAGEACPPGTNVNSANGACVCPDGTQQVTVAVDSGTHCVPINKNSANLSDNPIYFYLKNILKFMSAGVGLAVVGGICVGGYMYITARANAGQVEKAKVVIINSIIGLLLYIFMFAILQFLIPGGILS